MKKLNPKLILFYCVVLVFIYQTSFSQSNVAMNNNINKNISVSGKYQNDLMALPQFQYSSEEKEIINQINQLKEQNIPGNSEKILELQKQLESVSGRSITKPEESFGSTLTPISKNKIQNNNFSLNQIYSGSLVKGIASQVQQRYAGAGTIWVAVGAGTPDTGAAAVGDTLIVYRSLDNTGTSFAEFTRIFIGATNKFYPEDAIDMEIIELNNLTNYIYIVYNYTTNGYNGRQKAGCSVIRDNPSLVNNFTLNFPGSASSSNNYLRPRITSDAATYYVSPYITIALVQDSAVGTNHYYLTKYCRIVNPFTTTPAISYLPKSLYIAGASPEDVTFTVQVDIAYVSTAGSPSNKIVFVLSGYPQFGSHIYVYKTDAALAGYSFWNYQFEENNKELEFMRIASNGGSGQSGVRAIFSSDFDNNGNWKLGILETDITDGNDLWGGTVYLDPFGSRRFGDVIGRRNAKGSFAFAYKNVYGCAFSNNVYMMQSGGSSNKIISSLNYEYCSSHASPKPVFRFQNNDSCLAITPGYYEVNSKAGCDASLVLDLKLNIEGLYDAGTDLHRWDDRIYVYLANKNSPYNIIDSATNFICSNDNSGSYVFKNAQEGTYYFLIKHRNSIETWSKDTIHLYTSNEPLYNFTNANSAFGDNVLQVNSDPDRYAIYSGDVNQDGAVDLTDLSLIDNDVNNFVSGYVSTDVYVDYFVDIADLAMTDNNAFNFVSVVRP